VLSYGGNLLAALGIEISGGIVTRCNWRARMPVVVTGLRLPDSIPVLETTQLLLTAPIGDDRQTLFEIYNEADVLAFLNRGEKLAIDQLDVALQDVPKEAARRERYTFAMRTRSPGNVVGIVQLEHIDLKQRAASISVFLGAPYRRNHYAKEAVKRVIEWSFEIGLDHVYAAIIPSNRPSAALMRSLGMTDDGLQMHTDLSGNPLALRIFRTSRAS